MHLRNIQVVLPDLKSSQPLVLERWAEKSELKLFLKKYGIDPDEFIQRYAKKLISNAIHIIETDFSTHEHLVTKEMLYTFKDRNINPYDIFCLFQSLKDVCVTLIQERDILSSSILLNPECIIIDIYRSFEYLTKEILLYYSEELYFP